MPRLLLTILVMVVLIPPPGAGASVWRSTITLPENTLSIPALDAFVIADQLADSAAVVAALARTDWSLHLRDWCAARWARKNGDLEGALVHYQHAADKWPSGAGEPDLVLELFDRERIDVALDAGDLEAARNVVRTPLRPHHSAIWRALRARVELVGGESAAAAERISRAWEQADELDRRHPVFLYAASAHLATGDPDLAVQSWQASLEVIRRPERLRAALRVWDSLPELRTAVSSSPDPEATIRFLVRVLRREEAADLVRSRIERGEGDPAEQELFIAEQLYRLREHDRLLAWLEALDREGWTPDQLARAEGYLWGVARRREVSVEVARGFDSIATTWPDEPRSAEALWESAWMYELSESPEEAVDRYGRHVEATTGGRFRSSAALRTILLPWLGDDTDLARANHERFEPALGEGMDQAAAWWILDQGRDESDREFTDRLHEEHPASPFWRGLAPSVTSDRAPSPELLHSRQDDALAVISAELALEDPLQELPPDLAAIARIAELGLKTEATVLLQAWARANGSSDASRLRVVAIAFATGLPEVQGRQGWFLDRRLRGRSPELDAALRAAALPTPFAGAIRAVSAAQDLPPSLIWALMRRESFFDPDVVSLASAYGLMQLLPKTASRVASRLGLADPAPSSLFAPSVNITLGSAYLAGLRDEASGNWIRALASYNAGETNGERWEARVPQGADPAVGILLISYTETRSYVYNVLRVAHLYEDVWHGEF